MVLAYNAIADLRGDPVLAPYGVPRERFIEHLDALARWGWRFVDLDGVLSTLAGERFLPPRAVLVTFDDAYVDLLDAACPVLAERQIPAAAFAVAGLVGRTNEWDHAIGAGTVALLDAGGLRAVADRGIEIGSHAATHRPLPGVPADELSAELAGSATQLETLGLPRPRVLAYPHGEWTAAVAAEVHRAGYIAAFTVRAGLIEAGADPHALPRVEPLAEDTACQLRLKIATAGWPKRPRDWVLRLLRAR